MPPPIPFDVEEVALPWSITEEAVIALPFTVPWTITLSPTSKFETDEVALPLTIVAEVTSTVYVTLLALVMVSEDPVMPVILPPTTGWPLP